MVLSAGVPQMVNGSRFVDLSPSYTDLFAMYVATN